jgi:HEAT repeat protein
VPVLIANLQDNWEEVRQVAARTFLGLARGENSLPDSKEARLNSEAFALAAFSQGVPALVRALSDSSKYVRTLAGYTLVEIERHAPRSIAQKLRKMREKHNQKVEQERGT